MGLTLHRINHYRRVTKRTPNCCWKNDAERNSPSIINEQSQPMTTHYQLGSLTDVATNQWDKAMDQQDPFFKRTFLAALEQTHCVGKHNGWQPYHLSVGDKDDPKGFLPLYLKDHSEGEFVFDWNWASASQSAGIPYYPKLVSSIPFTPVTGPRLFSQSSDTTIELLHGLKTAAEEHQASSWHLLFPDEATAQAIKAASSHIPGFELLERRDCHFIWNNKGYQTFDDFLATFNSRKRKNIKKERRKLIEQDVVFEHLEGEQIKPQHIEIFYAFYQQTYRVRGRQPYLSNDFFYQLLTNNPDKSLLLIATQQSTPVGAALFLVGDQTLYGRWWGGDPSIDCLHFETCYYQGIEYAIRNGLQRFDPGIQGEHKLLRGFEPEQTRSLHWIRESRLADAISQWLSHERKHIDQYQNSAETFLPYKKTN